MTFFKYNGCRSDEFGLHIQKKDVFSAPEYDVDFTSIPGRSGDLIVSNHRFANIKVTYTVFLARRNVTDLADVLRAVKGWLYTEPDRYHELTDSYDPDHIRYGVIKGGLDIEEQLGKVGSFRVTFTCKPYKYSTAGMENIVLLENGTVFNPEAFNAKPLLTLHGTGDFTLTLQNGSYNKTWSFSGINLGGIVCDSEQMNFFYGSTLLNDKVTGDGFPEFPPGETTITTSGTLPMMTIQPRWCCL